MRIGQLAERTGVSARSLRYYELQGLLSPARTPGGQRVYAAEDAHRVDHIRELFAAGFCSTMIERLLPVLARPEESADALRAAIQDARTRLESERAAIDHELAALEDLGTRLGLDPDTHVRVQAHDHGQQCAEAAAFDHRDRRLR